MENSIYIIFLVCCFATFCGTPYLLIRYITLKRFIRSGKYVSKIKAWIWAVLCSPITYGFVMLVCNFFGDGYFLSFFILLGILIACPVLLYFFLVPKITKLEQELEN